MQLKLRASMVRNVRSFGAKHFAEGTAWRDSRQETSKFWVDSPTLGQTQAVRRAQAQLSEVLDTLTEEDRKARIFFSGVLWTLMGSWREFGDRT